MSQRRRSRFTVTTDRGLQVILAYSSAGAREYYEARGHTVRSVERGDHRRKAAVQEIKSQGRAGRPSPMGVREAASALGLRLPVEVTIRNGENLTLGSHAVIADDMRVISLSNQPATVLRHRIALKGWLPAERMREVIGHELTHALQFERDILPHATDAHDAIMRRKRAYNDGTSYKFKRQEREAKAAEKPFAARFPQVAR